MMLQVGSKVTIKPIVSTKEINEAGITETDVGTVDCIEHHRQGRTDKWPYHVVFERDTTGFWFGAHELVEVQS